MKMLKILKINNNTQQTNSSLKEEKFVSSEIKSFPKKPKIFPKDIDKKEELNKIEELKNSSDINEIKDEPKEMYII